MNSILGFIELIEDKDLSPEKHKPFLSNINESSQIQSAYRIRGEGPGFGLALSFHLTRILNGELFLGKTSQEGSTFCLRLPVNLRPES
jgi:signal transduction histidine kinase